MKTVKITKRNNLRSVEMYEGETIEMKVARVVQNKEPITDGAPIIYTERGQGVLPDYNPRTDRWDIAIETMDKVNRAKIAKSENGIGDVPQSPEEGSPSVN